MAHSNPHGSREDLGEHHRSPRGSRDDLAGRQQRGSREDLDGRRYGGSREQIAAEMRRSRESLDRSREIIEPKPHGDTTFDSGLGGLKSAEEKRSTLKRMSDVFKRGGGGGDGGGTNANGEGSSFGFRESFRKMKGMFHRGPPGQTGHDESQGSGIELEEPRRIDLSPGGYDLNPSGTLTPQPTRSAAMKSGFKNFIMWKSPPTQFKHKLSDEGNAELNPIPGKPIIRMSNIINITLVLGIITGIILTAVGSDDKVVQQVIGPCFIVLSIFGLIGKVFFTLFFEDEPCPTLRPYITKIEDTIGGVKDPYKFEQPQAKRVPGGGYYTYQTGKSMPGMVQPTIVTMPGLTQTTVVETTVSTYPGQPTYPAQPSPAFPTPPTQHQLAASMAPPNPIYDEIDTELRPRGDSPGPPPPHTHATFSTPSPDTTSQPAGRSTPLFI